MVWRFRAKPEKLAKFERTYSATGAWAQLFRRDPAFRQTRLLRDSEQPASFLVIDEWNDLESYESFKAKHRAEYDELDRQCEALTEEETRIGIFEDFQFN